MRLSAFEVLKVRLMKIEERDYTNLEFITYLTEHSNQIFKGKRKSWLKIYALLVSDDGWRTRLFKTSEIKQLGQILKVKLENQEQTDGEKENEYYIMEYRKGLILLYTTANQETYEQNLGKRIEKSIGVTKMWIPPESFNMFWNSILQETNGYVYRFSSEKGSYAIYPAQRRPEVKRRLSYTGEDATESLQELTELYGVVPYSVYIRASQSLKLHMTNDGLYSAQKASSRAIQLFYSYLQKIEEEILGIRKTSKELKFDIVSESNLKIPAICSGVIKIKNGEIDELGIKALRSKLNKFSFIDSHIEHGSLSFTSTVIDEVKGSVFDISASGNQILIVPKFSSTFESFITLYRGVIESIDKEAELSLVEAQ